MTQVQSSSGFWPILCSRLICQIFHGETREYRLSHIPNERVFLLEVLVKGSALSFVSTVDDDADHQESTGLGVLNVYQALSILYGPSKGSFSSLFVDPSCPSLPGAWL